MKTLFLTDDYFSVINEDGKKRSFTYKANPSACELARKLINAASHDAPASFFESDVDISLGKRVALLDSAEFTGCEVCLRSRFNTVFNEITAPSSIIPRIAERIIGIAERLNPETMKEDVFTGWGRPDFSDLNGKQESALESLKPEEYSESIKGTLFSISLLKDRAEFIILSPEGFRKVSMNETDYKRFDESFMFFLNNFKDCFTDMQYKRLLFLGNRCRRCGECCKIYEVEVNEFEQERIAGHIGVSHKEFIEKYLHENKFSWNEFSFMLNKVKGFGTPCMFQGKCPDGGYGCSIYPVRPEVCRKFLPSLGKCVLNKTLPNIQAVRDSLVSFNMTEESCAFDTEMTNGNRINPVLLDVNKNNSAFKQLTELFGDLAKRHNI